MHIRPILESDRPEWLRLRQALWPETSAAEHQTEMDEIPQDNAQAVFIAQDASGKLCGFIEVALRPWAEGCETRPVGYIEGWYVETGARRQRVGAGLVAVAEAWARQQGCREMGSDCLLDNQVSFQAHLALGYQEVERVIQFRKSL